MNKFSLFLCSLICFVSLNLHAVEQADIEPKIHEQIQNQIAQIPKSELFEQNVLDSFAITNHIKGIGYKVAFHLANRDEYQAFFDESGRWISLNHLFDAYAQVNNQTYVLETVASIPKLHVYYKNKLKKSLVLPANPQMRNLPEMVTRPEFGDNYGFSEEFANKFSQISKNFLPIYYQPSKDLSTLKVLLIDTNKNEFLNFDLPISEVIPLKNKRYLVYQRYEAEDTFYLSYFYVVDANLNITDRLDEINTYLKLHSDGFEGFKYYLKTGGEVTLSFIPQNGSRKQPPENIFEVK